MIAWLFAPDIMYGSASVPVQSVDTPRYAMRGWDGIYALCWVINNNTKFRTRAYLN